MIRKAKIPKELMMAAITHWISPSEGKKNGLVTSDTGEISASQDAGDVMSCAGQEGPAQCLRHPLEMTQNGVNGSS